ncbi:hypothetical protein JXH75_004811 [Salmonella enterica subsp. enterica serovar Oranienburg]|nr:hypothetical protein [Salmonella enterica subsp. enterica]EHB3563881.1 hypothetical protein [Salmonella enterica subsp. enterica serovar Oranienburg]EHJ0379631.1 hypothetical protein [Salmonella enterica]EHW8690981.1 hypothetical protein [Salmonella enterica subsp. enterica serovar Saintpaul]
MSEIKVKLLALLFLCPALACSAQNFSPDFVKHVFSLTSLITASGLVPPSLL